MFLFYFLGLGTFLLGLVIGYGLARQNNEDIESSLADQADRLSAFESVLARLVSSNNANVEALSQTANRLQAWIEIQRAEIPLELDE